MHPVDRQEYVIVTEEGESLILFRGDVVAYVENEEAATQLVQRANWLLTQTRAVYEAASLLDPDTV